MTTKLRSVIFWIHLAAGLLAGTVILIMSVTGTLLTFQQEILLLIERSERVVTPPGPAAARLDADQLIQAVRDARPGAQPTTLTLESDPELAATVALGTAGNVFVNPYTGEVLGSGSARARAFYRSVTNWHRYLATSGEQRALGKAITGACNAAFLFLAMSGLYLWFPRQWTRQHLAPIVWFRRGARGRARDFNWHNVIGLWSAPILIVLTLSGMVISYPWASNLIYKITGSPLPAANAARNPAPSTTTSTERGEAPGSSRSGSVPLERFIRDGERHVSTWRTMTLRLPSGPGASASVTVSDTAHWNRFARSTLTLDGATGAVVRWEPVRCQQSWPEDARVAAFRTHG